MHFMLQLILVYLAWIVYAENLCNLIHAVEIKEMEVYMSFRLKECLKTYKSTTTFFQ